MIILSKTKVFSTICVFWQANQSVMCQSSTWLLMPSSIIKELSETYRLVVTPRDKCWIHEIPSFDFRWGSPPIRLIYLCWSSAKSPHSIQLFCACTSEPASRFLKSYFHCTCHFWIFGVAYFNDKSKSNLDSFQWQFFFCRCNIFFGLVIAQITLCGVNRDIAFNRCNEDAQHAVVAVLSSKETPPLLVRKSWLIALEIERPDHHVRER